MKPALVLVLVILGATVFFLQKKSKEGVKQTSATSSEKTASESKTNGSGAPGGLDESQKSMLDGADSEEERKERMAYIHDPQKDSFACDSSDTRPFCAIFKVPQEKPWGIELDKGMIIVKAPAEKYFKEADSIMSFVANKNPREIATIALLLFLKEETKKSELIGVDNFRFVIKLKEENQKDSPRGIVAIIPEGGIDRLMQFTEDNLKSFQKNKNFDFFVKAQRDFTLAYPK